jgi:hypothetical protein
MSTLLGPNLLLTSYLSSSSALLFLLTVSPVLESYVAGAFSLDVLLRTLLVSPLFNKLNHTEHDDPTTLLHSWTLLS